MVSTLALVQLFINRFLQVHIKYSNCPHTPTSGFAHMCVCVCRHTRTHTHTHEHTHLKSNFPPEHQEKFPFPLKCFSNSLILFYFFIYFSAISFSIWKVTWPLFPHLFSAFPLFSLGMKHRTRLKAFNGYSIGRKEPLGAFIRYEDPQ